MKKDYCVHKTFGNLGRESERLQEQEQTGNMKDVEANL